MTFDTSLPHHLGAVDAGKHISGRERRGTDGHRLINPLIYGNKGRLTLGSPPLLTIVDDTRVCVLVGGGANLQDDIPPLLIVSFYHTHTLPTEHKRVMWI